VTLASGAVEKAGYSPLRALLALQAALLAGWLGLGVALGPDASADSPPVVLVGMLAVAAMATRNALVKLALPGAPSTQRSHSRLKSFLELPFSTVAVRGVRPASR
jgi:hypothetical protein